MLLAGLGSVRIGKNCDLGLENDALGHIFKTSVTRRTSQPAKNIYIFFATRAILIIGEYNPDIPQFDGLN